MRIALPIVLLIGAGLGYFVVQFVINANFREVVPNTVYRSGQPTAEQLQTWIEEYGIRTIINLRGTQLKILGAERDLASTLGVDWQAFSLSAYALPSRAMLTQIIHALEEAELPVLIHCRQGIDRAGTISAIAKMAIGQVGYRTAKWQAFVPPGPWKHRNGAPHISDVFVLYERYCRDEGLEPTGWAQFKSWALNVYEPSDISAPIKAGIIEAQTEPRSFSPSLKIDAAQP